MFCVTFGDYREAFWFPQIKDDKRQILELRVFKLCLRQSVGDIFVPADLR